jgi:hypothetical protein
MIVKNSGNNFLSSDWLISVLPAGFLIPCATAAIDLPAGSATGSVTYDGATAELKVRGRVRHRTDSKRLETSGRKMGELSRADAWV